MNAKILQMAVSNYHFNLYSINERYGKVLAKRKEKRNRLIHVLAEISYECNQQTCVVYQSSFPVNAAGFSGDTNEFDRRQFLSNNYAATLNNKANEKTATTSGATATAHNRIDEKDEQRKQHSKKNSPYRRCQLSLPSPVILFCYVHVFVALVLSNFRYNCWCSASLNTKGGTLDYNNDNSNTTNSVTNSTAAAAASSLSAMLLSPSAVPVALHSTATIPLLLTHQAITEKINDTFISNNNTLPSSSATKKIHDFAALQAELPDINRKLSNQSMPGSGIGGAPNINDVCLQAPDYGHCTAKHERFTFSAASRKCQPFIWSGCGGNENRFFSEKQCYDACFGETGFNPNTYRGHTISDNNNNRPPQQHFPPPNSFDWERTTTTTTTTGGGIMNNNGENNNVDIIQQQQHSAATPPSSVVVSSHHHPHHATSSLSTKQHVDPRCYEAVKRGMCSKYIPRWYFNGSQCDLFYYSGCGPTTENNFGTMEECQHLCGVSKPGEARQEVCSLEPERGYCGGPSLSQSTTLPSTGPLSVPQIKWYYNLVDQTCSQFVWSTCEGNANRFETKQDCLNLCQAFTKAEKQQAIIDNNNAGRIMQPPPNHPQTTNIYPHNQHNYQDPIAQHQLPHHHPSSINSASYSPPLIPPLQQQHQQQQHQVVSQHANNSPSPSGGMYETGSFQPPPQRGGVGVSAGGVGTNRPNPSWPISPGISTPNDDFFSNTPTQNQLPGVGGIGAGYAEGSIPHPPPLLPTQMPLAPSRQQQNQRQPSLPSAPGVGVGANSNQRQEPYPRLPNTQHLPPECAMPADKGTCLQDIKRWYFDALNARCRPFYWSGCGGSFNNFVSHSECEDRCIVAISAATVASANQTASSSSLLNNPGGISQHHRPLPDVTIDTSSTSQSECLLPVERGPCLGETLRYGYDASDNSCKAFMYGCGGNENNFLNENDCLFRCSGVSSSSVASSSSQQQQVIIPRPRPSVIAASNQQQHNEGADPAGVGVPSGFVDTTTGVGVGDLSRFNTNNGNTNVRGVGGVSGVGVGVDTKTTTNPLCLLPPAEGYCAAKHIRWYYNSDTEQCTTFAFTGCGGNENNFMNMNDCIEVCGAATVVHPPTGSNARASLLSLSSSGGTTTTARDRTNNYIGSLAATDATAGFWNNRGGIFWPPSNRIIAAASEPHIDMISPLTTATEEFTDPQLKRIKIGGGQNSKVQLNYVGSVKRSTTGQQQQQLPSSSRLRSSRTSKSTFLNDFNDPLLVHKKRLPSTTRAIQQHQNNLEGIAEGEQSPNQQQHPWPTDNQQQQQQESQSEFFSPYNNNNNNNNQNEVSPPRSIAIEHGFMKARPLESELPAPADAALSDGTSTTTTSKIMVSLVISTPTTEQKNNKQSAKNKLSAMTARSRTARTAATTIAAAAASNNSETDILSSAITTTTTTLPVFVRITAAPTSSATDVTNKSMIVDETTTHNPTNA